jgi:hypothetical protein
MSEKTFFDSLNLAMQFDFSSKPAYLSLLKRWKFEELSTQEFEAYTC